MERPPIVVTVSLAVMVGIALTPTAALAQRFHGGAGGGHVIAGGRPFGSHAFVSHPFFRRPFFPRPFFHHRFFSPFFPFGVFGSPGIGYAAPPVFYGSPGYYDQSGYYDAPPVYSPPVGGTVSVAPSPPDVIEYPTGRYELRGDGVTTPYTWVWIPNPPPPPAPAAPAAGASPSGDLSPARQGEFYGWTDQQGVAHWTNRWDTIPEQYRTQAKRLAL